MYNCIKVLKCIFCVMPILSSAGSNISIMVQMFPNKDGSSVDGKSFSDGGIFVVFPRTISLFLLRWSFFGFISVFKPITNLFLLFSEKNGICISQPLISWKEVWNTILQNNVCPSGISSDGSIRSEGGEYQCGGPALFHENFMEKNPKTIVAKEYIISSDKDQ